MMRKLAIDTNVLLGFYRTGKDKLATLGDLARLGEQVVFPEQVMREFRRNRESVIDEYLKMFSTPAVPLAPGFLADSTEHAEVATAHAAYKKAFDQLVRLARDRQRDPSRDPVAQKVESLYKSAKRLDVSDAMVDRARRRNLRGDPPSSTKKRSVGDEIIWETILDAVQDDLVLVTRDSGFTDSAAFLVTEYRERTGRKLEMVGKISEAQKRLGRPRKETERAKKGEQEAMGWTVRFMKLRDKSLQSATTTASSGSAFSSTLSLDETPRFCAKCGTPLGPKGDCKMCGSG